MWPKFLNSIIKRSVLRVSHSKLPTLERVNLRTANLTTELFRKKMHWKRPYLYFTSRSKSCLHKYPWWNLIKRTTMTNRRGWEMKIETSSIGIFFVVKFVSIFYRIFVMLIFLRIVRLISMCFFCIQKTKPNAVTYASLLLHLILLKIRNF